MRLKDPLLFVRFVAWLVQPSIMNLVLHFESLTSHFYSSCALGFGHKYFSLWVHGFLHTETLWGFEWKIIKPTMFSREKPQPQNMRGQNKATCTQYFGRENIMWAAWCDPQKIGGFVLTDAFRNLWKGESRTKTVNILQKPPFWKNFFACSKFD